MADSQDVINSNNAKWAERGITWGMVKVARRAGTNASDKTYYPHPGPLLIVTADNLDRFIKSDPRHLEAITSHLDGQSFRVAGQRVLRAAFEKGTKVATVAEMEALRQRVYDGVVLSTRAASTVTVVQEVYKYILPNGSEYKGSDEMEFRQLFMASLVDLGVDNMIAQEKALSVQW